MKCSETWSFEQYLPPNRTDEIFINQVVPLTSGIYLTWCGTEGKCTVYYRKKDSDMPYLSLCVDEKKAELNGLTENEDYEFYVENTGKTSLVGYARTGYVPGTVVHYIHPDDKKYAFSGQHPCSPCILKHSNGYLLASMDVFDGGEPQNLTLIFRSDDNGKSWYHYTELFPCFWGTLFEHRGNVYMLATSTEYGDLLIGRSIDGGKNWERPTVLSRGSCHRVVPGWHKSSMPVIEYKGRVWCGVDYGTHKSGGHLTCLLSANAERDLTDASNWKISEPLRFSDAWEGAVKGDNRGFIEGSAIVLPNGEIGNMLRYMHDLGEQQWGVAGILQGSCEQPEKSLQPYRFVPFPGNLSKFDVKQDEKSGMYFTIMSRIKEGYWFKMRNLLSFAYSSDLEHWYILQDLLDYSDEDPQKIGFQYVSFCFDGDDIIYLSRTAFNGAQNYHDNNFVTFHRIPDFRSMLPKQELS